MDAEARPDATPADTVAWEAQSGPQTALVTCPVFEIFYGGARGGGKTDGVLGEWLNHADEYGSGAIGLMIRRTRVQLIETIERSKEIYAPLGAQFHEQDKMWRFPNGARLRFAYLERDADAEAYQGHSYTRVYIEELGNFPTEKPIMKLMATLRSANGVPVGFRATGNPGGPGHSWVRARYIDPAPMGWQVINDERSGLERIYIPSRIADNHYLGEDYIQRLKQSGSAELVRAWLEGDWNAIEGAFFDGWRTETHVVAPFAIPDHWVRYRSFDWGFAKPFSVGWWAVASEPVAVGVVRGGSGRDDDLDGSTPTALPRTPRLHISPSGTAGTAGSGWQIPRGALVRYREWYGASDPNVGIRLQAEDIAKGILSREKDESISFGVADPSIWAESGAAHGLSGPSIGERLQRSGVVFRPADNRRKQGWDQMRARIKGDADGNPMLVVFDTCTDFIRTVPVLQHDNLNPEDLDTDGEDHAADEARYAAMARPWTAPSPQAERPLVETRMPTLAEHVQATMRGRARSGQRI